jgi:hypothetical protein
VLNINVERPFVVLTSWEVLTYPIDPKPATVLVSCERGKIFAVVLTKFPVEIYREGSKNQSTVLTSWEVLTYDAEPRPCTVLRSCGELIYPRDPSPMVVLVNWGV